MCWSEPWSNQRLCFFAFLQTSWPWAEPKLNRYAFSSILQLSCRETVSRFSGAASSSCAFCSFSSQLPTFPAAVLAVMWLVSWWGREDGCSIPMGRGRLRVCKEGGGEGDCVTGRLSESMGAGGRKPEGRTTSEVMVLVSSVGCRTRLGCQELFVFRPLSEGTVGGILRRFGTIISPSSGSGDDDIRRLLCRFKIRRRGNVVMGW